MADETPPARHVFLVDDHPLVRQGLAAVLSQAGFAVCGEANNGTETLQHAQLASADLAIVDLALGEENGADLIAALRARGIRVLVYTMHEEPSRVTGALAAGAAGYVTKREVAQYLVEAVREVLAGELYVSPRAAAGLAKRAANRAMDDASLSEQQRHVYRLLGEGASTGEIAEQLHVSPRTVESYCARMIEKLGLAGMKELRRQAIADRLGGAR
ncbi:MAG TPA: response regulator transcription factor [Candidatus Anammoximicrobium sp.]|nr:response regulator transcription factor [Candidatus Anammoximicrobium sp.]